MNPDGWFWTMDRYWKGFMDLLGQPASSYCEIETVDPSERMEDVLIGTDGSLMTMVRIEGMLTMQDHSTYERLIGTLADDLSPYFNESGYTLHFTMNFNPDAAQDEIHDLMEPRRKTARRLDLSMEDVLEGWEKSLSGYTASESVILAAWTHPESLTQSEQKHEKNRRNERLQNEPYAPDAQTTQAGLHGLRDRHKAFINQILNIFSGAGVSARPLEATDALRTMRRWINPAESTPEWSPYLPGDPVPGRIEEYDHLPDDCSNGWFPRLDHQIFPWDAEVVNNKVVRIGNRFYSPVTMTLPPKANMETNGTKHTPYFSQLFNELNNKGIPWRSSFRIAGDGVGALRLKSIMGRVLSWATPLTQNNYRLNNSCQWIQDQYANDRTIARFQASFLTWGESVEEVRSRRNEMKTGIQSWRGAQVSDVTGDPLLGLSTTIPGYMQQGIGRMAGSPIDEAFRMMPLRRPAAIWGNKTQREQDEGEQRSGSGLPLRSMDGKLTPYRQGSSKQAAWIDIEVGPMGSGKSVQLNTLNLDFCLDTDGDKLPFLSIIDIGKSSKGLISLLRGGLPDDEKEQAQFHRLQMDESYAINPFDTELMVYYPIPKHRQYLINLIKVLSSSNSQCPEGVKGLARQAIDTVYRKKAPVDSAVGSAQSNPNPFNENADSRVTSRLHDLGYEYDSDTTWWDVTRFLFHNQEFNLARRAQRFAVPQIKNIGNVIENDDDIRRQYDKTVHGEKLYEMVARKCREARREYEVLSSHTQWSVQNARVLSLDLGEVAPKSDPQQTALMYMLARHKAARRFFLMEEDLQHIPETARPYHAKRIDQIRQQEKRFCMDEVHRIQDIDAMMDQIETDIREGRKWNLHIGLSSQDIDDFSDAMVDFATSIFVMGVGKERNLDRLDEIIGLNDTARTNVMRSTGNPGKHGANMLAYFDTNIRAGRGYVLQMMTNTLGPRAIWAFDTTTENVAVRDRLYKRVGPETARNILARLYPNPDDVEDEINRRKDEAGKWDTDDVVNELVEDILEDAKMMLGEDMVHE